MTIEFIYSRRVLFAAALLTSSLFATTSQAALCGAENLSKGCYSEVFNDFTQDLLRLNGLVAQKTAGLSLRPARKIS